MWKDVLNTLRTSEKVDDRVADIMAEIFPGNVKEEAAETRVKEEAETDEPIKKQRKNNWDPFTRHIFATKLGQLDGAIRPTCNWLKEHLNIDVPNLRGPRRTNR